MGSMASMSPSLTCQILETIRMRGCRATKGGSRADAKSVIHAVSAVGFARSLYVCDDRRIGLCAI